MCVCFLKSFRKLNRRVDTIQADVIFFPELYDFSWSRAGGGADAVPFRRARTLRATATLTTLPIVLLAGPHAASKAQRKRTAGWPAHKTASLISFSSPQAPPPFHLE